MWQNSNPASAAEQFPPSPSLPGQPCRSSSSCQRVPVQGTGEGERLTPGTANVLPNRVPTGLTPGPHSAGRWAVVVGRRGKQLCPALVPLPCLHVGLMPMAVPGKRPGVQVCFHCPTRPRLRCKCLTSAEAKGLLHMASFSCHYFCFPRQCRKLSVLSRVPVQGWRPGVLCQQLLCITSETRAVDKEKLSGED